MYVCYVYIPVRWYYDTMYVPKQCMKRLLYSAVSHCWFSHHSARCISAISSRSALHGLSLLGLFIYTYIADTSFLIASCRVTNNGFVSFADVATVFYNWMTEWNVFNLTSVCMSVCVRVCVPSTSIVMYFTSLSILFPVWEYIVYVRMHTNISVVCTPCTSVHLTLTLPFSLPLPPPPPPTPMTCPLTRSICTMAPSLAKLPTLCHS